MKLLPCPWCGKDPELREPTNEDPWYYIYCRCFSQNIFLSGEDYKAVAKWNSRAQPKETDGETSV